MTDDKGMMEHLGTSLPSDREVKTVMPEKPKEKLYQIAPPTIPEGARMKITGRIYQMVKGGYRRVE